MLSKEIKFQENANGRERFFNYFQTSTFWPRGFRSKQNFCITVQGYCSLSRKSSFFSFLWLHKMFSCWNGRIERASIERGTSLRFEINNECLRYLLTIDSSLKKRLWLYKSLVDQLFAGVFKLLLWEFEVKRLLEDIF